MAIRPVKSNGSIKVDVLMKDGRKFIQCDIPTTTDDASGLTVPFFVEDRLCVVPLQDVLILEFYDVK